MSQQDLIVKALKDEENYSANEIAEIARAPVTSVRSIASRLKIKMPTQWDRLKALRNKRDALLKELRGEERLNDMLHVPPKKRKRASRGRSIPRP